MEKKALKILKRSWLPIVVALACCVSLLVAGMQSSKAWADDSKGPYAMIYKNPGSYTYTLVFQNDNTADSRYGTLTEHSKAICDSPNPGGSCSCWSTWKTNLDITNVVVRDPMQPHTMDSWFWGLQNLESVDLAKLDTSQVYDMSYMFYNCNKLKTVNLNTFDTRNVKTFARMFAYCRALNSVNVSSFNTDNATDMSSMFAGCNELTTLDLSSFNMRNVLDATSMFPDDYGKLATVKVGANGNVCTLLPTPSRYYIEGATGKWVGASGTAYASSSIPAYKADTYKAQRGYSVADLTVSLADYWYDYTGQAIKPAVSVKLSYDTPLKQGKDYTVSYSNNVNAGKATVTIKGIGNYGGTATKTFSIYPLSIGSSNVAKIPVQDYTGKARKPVPTIKVGGKTLKVGRDFTVKYYSNKRVGTAMVYIAGKGNYASGCYANFTIAKRSKQPMTVKANAKSAKAKTLKKKAVVLSKTVTVKKAKGKVAYKNVSTQKAAKKFKVNAKTGKITLSKGTKKGTYKVKIKATAAGNTSYKPGSKTVTVKVVVK